MAAKKVRQITIKINSFENKLTALEEIITQNQFEVTSLKLRTEDIKVSFRDYQNFIDELIALQPNHNLVTESPTTVNKYYDLIGTVENIVKVQDDAQSSRSSSSVSNEVSNGSSSDATNSSSTAASNDSHQIAPTRMYKLERLRVPKFTGNYEDWLSFKNTFKAMVHSQTQYPDIEKFQYLQSALEEGAAKHKISGLDITGENYKEAWDLLEQSYEVKRLLINRHLQLIFNLPEQKDESGKDLDKIADKVQQYSSALEKMGYPIHSVILVFIIETKLHPKTLQKWEYSLERNQIPTIREMRDFLYKIALTTTGHHRIAKRKGDSLQHDSTKKKKVDLRQTLVTQSNNNNNANNNDNNHNNYVQKDCVLCDKEKHHLYRCPKFKGMEVPQRIEVLKKEKVCFNCMKDHKNRPCTHRSCMKCSRNHNTMIHYDNRTKNKPNANTTDKPPSTLNKEIPNATSD